MNFTRSYGKYYAGAFTVARQSPITVSQGKQRRPNVDLVDYLADEDHSKDHNLDIPCVL